MDKKKKKVIISTIAASVFLLVLIISATYAYFNTNDTATGETNLTGETTKIGNVIVVNPTENLYLKLSASDMQESKAGTSYYATSINSSSSSVYSLEEEYNSIANMQVQGGEAGTKYKCTFDINITKPQDIRSGDMSITFKRTSGVPIEVNNISLGSSIDLYESSNKYQATFVADGSNSEGLDILSASVVLNNTTGDQSHIAGKNLGISITINNLNCEITKEELLLAGAYDDNGVMLASWDELVNDYGLDISKDTTPIDTANPSTWYYITNNNENLKNTTKLIVGDGVTTLGGYAFWNSKLNYLELPSTLTNHNAYSLAVISSLKELVINSSASLVQAGISSLINLTNIKFNSSVVPSIGGSTKLETVELGENVTTISDSAFSGCTQLKSINIPDSVTSIGNGAFNGCTSLTKVNIPNGITSIGISTFYNTGLTSIEIPDSVTTIGRDAFSNCTNLSSLKLSENITSLDMSIYSGTAVKYVKIPDKVTSISIPPEYAMTSNNVSNIETLEIGAGLREIVNSALNVARNSKNIIINSNNTTFELKDGMLINKTTKTLEKSFSNVNNIPNGILIIAAGAFLGNQNVSNVVIPDGVTKIGDWSFAQSSITSITIPASVTSIGPAFSGTKLKTINYKGSESDWSKFNMNTLFTGQVPSDLQINYNYTG